MNNKPSTSPQDPGASFGAGSRHIGSASARETYLWPLIALALAIVPQVLVPARMREGPPLAVPAIEAMVVLILLAVAGKQGRMAGAARPRVLSLFAVLIVANPAGAARLITLVLRSTPE